MRRIPLDVALMLAAAAGLPPVEPGPIEIRLPLPPREPTVDLEMQPLPAWPTRQQQRKAMRDAAKRARRRR